MADTPVPLCPCLRLFLDVRPHWLLLSHRSITLPMLFPITRVTRTVTPLASCPSCQLCNRARLWYLSTLDTVRERAGPKEIALVFLCSGCLFPYLKVNCRLTMNAPLYYECHTLLHLFLTTTCEVDTGCLSLISRCRLEVQRVRRQSRPGLES